MVDLAITEAQVLPDTSSGSKILNGIAGEAIAAGESCYKDTAANTWKLADASAVATLGLGDKCGVAVSAAEVATQKIAVQTRGLPILGAGAAPAAGTTYVVSATAGGIAPEADLGAGEFPCILGSGAGTNGLQLGPGGAGLSETAHA